MDDWPSLPQQMSLEGKVALVTGGGGGIGRACAIRFAQAGADVAIADIVPQRCEAVAAEIGKLGRKALPLPTNVMDTQEIEAAIKATEEEFGQLDILVNNAGGTRYVPFLEQSERSWRKHIDINLVSMLAATYHAAPLMMARGEGGAIINIASIEGMRAGPNVAVYAACKAAMINFTKSMALELSAHHIRVNCLAPDHTVTPGARGNRDGAVDPSTWRKPTADEQEKMNRVIPLLREGADYECGDAAVFLASNMSSYITGHTLNIDGGTFAASGWHRSSKGVWTQLEGQRPDR